MVILAGLGREDFGSELGRGADASIVDQPTRFYPRVCPPQLTALHPQDVAVNDLRHPQPPFVAQHVECLGLDVGRVHALPCQVIFGELGIRRVLGLFGHALDRGRAVNGLGDADAVPYRDMSEKIIIIIIIFKIKPRQRHGCSM